jgi:Domain of unknown function (DUF4124)
MRLKVRGVVQAGWMAALLLSGSAMAQSIYTCTNAQGRKITSDRPIAECTDRSQQEITPTGTVKRVVGPTLTAKERALQDEKDRQAAEARARELDEKRRDRALLLRYPNRQVHDTERALALAQVDEVSKASMVRAQELAEQRRLIDLDMEFYKKDPSKAPGSLKRRLDENQGAVLVQQRFLADQATEKQRVNQRFDEELVKLNQLWALMGPLPTTPAGRSASANN